MATECFKIEWTGYYTVDEAHSQPEARKLGLYAVYKADFGEKTLLYIGKATGIGTRLNHYRQTLQKFFPPEELKELQIYIGVLTSLDGESVDQKQLKNIESLFINVYKPERNGESTKKGYKGRSALVVSIGEIGKFKMLTAHDKKLRRLIKDAIVSDYDLWG